MKAALWKEPYKVAVEDVDDPEDGVIEEVGSAVRGVKQSFLVSHRLPLDAVGDAYEKFDKRADGYAKLLLKPQLVA